MMAISRGMITGNPRIAIIPELAPVFHAIALISPSVVVIPTLPRIIADVKSKAFGGELVGKGRKKRNTIAVNSPITSINKAA